MLASGIDFETESVDLDGIQNSARRIGKIGISSNDEIGMLYDSFNGMAQSSFEFIKQVQEQNDRRIPLFCDRLLCCRAP